MLQLDLPQTIEELPESVHEELLTKVAYKGIIEQRYICSQLPEGSKALGFTTACLLPISYLSQLPKTQYNSMKPSYSTTLPPT